MFLLIIPQKGETSMEEKLKKIEAELQALGINSVEELNEAIKKEKLDISLMTSPLPVKEAMAG